MIDPKEIKKLNKKVTEIGKELSAKKEDFSGPINRELFIGAANIRNTVITSMRDTPKTGKEYWRGKSGKSHIASSPGEPPAIDYGELVRSIMFDAGNMQIEIGSAGGAPYAVFLEKGTDRIEARPFLQLAVDKHKADIIAKVGDVAFEVIKEGFRGLK